MKKAMKGMKKMAKIQPQLQRLKERFKDDKEALNREMMLLMKEQGYKNVHQVPRIDKIVINMGVGEATADS